jgi:hypothetical protein
MREKIMGLPPVRRLIQLAIREPASHRPCSAAMLVPNIAQNEHARQKFLPFAFQPQALN